MNHLKSIILLVGVASLLSLDITESFGQRYIDGQDLTIVGKIMETAQPFHRVDTLKYPNLPKDVKSRGIESAGLAISFKSNSSSIYVKWCTDNQFPSANMTDISYRGVDLYIKNNGTWQFSGVGRPGRGINCSEAKVISNMMTEEREFLLYLPLYSETQNLQIGVDEKATLIAGDLPFEKTVIVYGSSIVQGASASRPGLAYPALLSRQTGINYINLGFSGVAKMDMSVVDMLAEYIADVYLLDCIPNSSPEQVSNRTGYLLSTLSKRHPSTPIVLMQSIIREHGYFDQEVGKRVAAQNQNAREEFLKAQQSGLKNLHFIFADELLGHDREGTLDGTHPNDLGFDRMVKVIRPKITSLLP